MTKPFQFTPEQQECYNNCTKLQQHTVINLIAGGMSQVKAYRKAGGKAKNDKVASVIVCKMLGQAKVRAFYDSLTIQEAGQSIMTRAESLEILTDIARTKITDVINFKTFEMEDSKGETIERSTWSIKEQDDMTEASKRAIQEVSAGKDGLKIKLHNQATAIKQIGVMQGWESATKHEHKVEGEVEIKDSSDKDLARKIAFLLTKGDLAKE